MIEVCPWLAAYAKNSADATGERGARRGEITAEARSTRSFRRIGQGVKPQISTGAVRIRPCMPSRPFSRLVLSAVDAAKIVGVRSGDEHRFTGIWVVVVRGRVFVRSWNDKPTGWYRAFVAEPAGTLSVDGREIRVRAKKTRGERLLDAIDSAYAAKYPTPGSRKYVVGFRTPRRRKVTLELVPA